MEVLVEHVSCVGGWELRCVGFGDGGIEKTEDVLDSERRTDRLGKGGAVE